MNRQCTRLPTKHGWAALSTAHCADFLREREKKYSTFNFSKINLSLLQIVFSFSLPVLKRSGSHSICVWQTCTRLRVRTLGRHSLSFPSPQEGRRPPPQLLASYSAKKDPHFCLWVCSLVSGYFVAPLGGRQRSEGLRTKWFLVVSLRVPIPNPLILSL